MTKKQLFLPIATVSVIMTCCFAIVQNWRNVFNAVAKIPILGWLSAYNFPPSDYYLPLQEIPLSAGIHTLRFKCRYNGRHEVQIRPIRVGSHVECGVRMKIKISDGVGNLAYEREKHSAAIMGGTRQNGTNVYNYCYAIFSVPKDVPLEKEVHMQIDCSGDVNEILKHNPDAKIVVKKCFDK